jgi:hypothetical protein
MTGMASPLIFFFFRGDERWQRGEPMDEKKRSERYSQRVDSPISGANKSACAIPAGDHNHSANPIRPLNFYPIRNNTTKEGQDTHNPSRNSRVIS